jgi:metal-dependent amidase/aminoacylase/carboxypeptidase family protein
LLHPLHPLVNYSARSLAALDPRLAVFGIHVIPNPIGFVGLRVGSNFAASRLVKIVVQGKQVHGSVPWLGKDPMIPAGNIITALPAIYRQMSANSAFTISIGHIVDQGRFNIIGDKVTLYGTIRAIENDDMAALCAKVKRTVDGICEAHDCTVTCEFLQPVPAIIHTEEWTKATWPTLERVAGKGKVHETEPRMGYDDVSGELSNCFPFVQSRANYVVFTRLLQNSSTSTEESTPPWAAKTSWSTKPPTGSSPSPAVAVSESTTTVRSTPMTRACPLVLGCM